MVLSETEVISKAKTFRKRRLSLNPMDETVIEEARKQHKEEAQQPTLTPSVSEGSPGLGGRSLKRRPSISPDMDQSGKEVQPPGMPSA